MKISELINELQKIQKQYGDLSCVDVMGDYIEAELGVKTKYGVAKYRKEFDGNPYVCIIL